MVPLLGRALQAGLWLWLLAFYRMGPSGPGLWVLLSRDLVWLAIVAVCVLAMRQGLVRQGVQT
jgi:hypothetical protein